MDSGSQRTTKNWIIQNMNPSDAADILPIFEKYKIVDVSDMKALSKEDLKKMKLSVGVRNRFLTACRKEKSTMTVSTQRINLLPERNHQVAQINFVRPACTNCKTIHQTSKEIKPNEEWVCKVCGCIHNLKKENPAPSSANKDWICVTCTFPNNNALTACSMCGAHHPDLPSNIPAPMNLMRHHSSPNRLQRSRTKEITALSLSISRQQNPSGKSKKQLKREILMREEKNKRAYRKIQGVRSYSPSVHEVIAKKIQQQPENLNLYFLNGMENMVRDLEKMQPHIHFGRAWMTKCEVEVLRQAYDRAKRAQRIYQGAWWF